RARPLAATRKRFSPFGVSGRSSSGISGVPWGTAMAWRTTRRRMGEAPSVAWIHGDAPPSRRRPRLAHGGQRARDDVGGQKGEERLVMGASGPEQPFVPGPRRPAHGRVSASAAGLGLPPEPFREEVGIVQRSQLVLEGA